MPSFQFSPTKFSATNQSNPITFQNSSLRPIYTNFLSLTFFFTLSFSISCLLLVGGSHFLCFFVCFRERRVIKIERKEKIHGDEQNLREEMEKIVSHCKSATIDYISVVDPETLESVPKVRSGDVALLAVRLGKTRLIDNVILMLLMALSWFRLC